MMQKFGTTWWGKQWLNAFSNIDKYSGLIFEEIGTLETVYNIEIEGNTIVANICGKGHKLYNTFALFSRFSQEKVDVLMDNILENPIVMSKLLNGELSPTIVDICNSLNLHIFPDSTNGFTATCSCKEKKGPCKHIVSVIYEICRKIDKNPFLIFNLHGIDFQKELEKRGILFKQTGIKSIPTHKSLFKTTQEIKRKINSSAINEEIDFSKLKNLTDSLYYLLDSNPAFYSKGDFLEVYYDEMKRISMEAEHHLDRIKESPKAVTEYLSHNDTIHISIDKNFDFILTMNTDDDLDFEIENLLLEALFLDLDCLEDYDISISSMHKLSLVALNLVAKGCIIPQIVSLQKDTYYIRWIPAILNDEVKTIVEKLSKIVPDDILTDTNGDIIENAYEHLLSYALSFYVSVFSQFFFDNMEIFFFKNNTLTFTNQEKKHYITDSIKSWLDRLDISNIKYKLSIVVSERKDDTFLLDFFVDYKGVDVPLNKILSLKKYEKERLEIISDASLLSHFLSNFDNYLNSQAKESLVFDLSTFAPIITKIIPAIRLLGIKVILPKSLQELIRPYPKVLISKRENSEKQHIHIDDLLNFDWQVALGDELVSEEYFKKLTEKACGLIKFKNNYIYVHVEDLARLYKALSSNKTLSSGEILQVALSESYHRTKIELTDDVRKIIQELTTYADISVPEEIKATLRPYQKRGFSWMYRNMKIGFGSIIADDMGLGKTLQVLTLLQKIKNDNLLDIKKAIIVVPTGLITNWLSEVKRFAPNLSIFVYHGHERNLNLFDTDILLTTYGVLRSDIEILKKKKWQIAVIDEAQNIKNANTSQSKAVRSLPAETRIAMSGTPVENRLSEFWSIMDFTNKGYLGSLKKFQEDYVKPIQNFGDKLVTENFRKISAPFMMRRLKTDKTIINDLPDKIELDEIVNLTDFQASLYNETLNEAMNLIEGIKDKDSKSLFKRSALVLQMILALKQICNHPALFLKDNNCNSEDSGKTMVLLDLLKSIVESEQKVLIFTQFKEMGTMLERMIFDAIGKRPLFLHGGCSVKERKAMVDRFQNNKDDQIFILSLKAAGTGLNLTAASHVIHYDLWWNPAVEAQATDRAYRIGQHQNVLVHRFIVKNTFEERINEMIQKKKELADMTIATGENWIGNLSNEELKEIFERE